jgi:hypothetical protein
MTKNIVICCDGTANEFAANNTNVVKPYGTKTQPRPDKSEGSILNIIIGILPGAPTREVPPI